MTTVLIVILLFSANASKAYAQIFTNLSYPSNARANVVKILPDRSLRAVSDYKDLLYLFNASGGLAQTVDLSQHRTFGIRYGDFDLWVNAQGEIFILSVWRDQSLKTGVFVYDNQGNYQRTVLLDKALVATRILVDAGGNLIVAGLSSDRYFGQSNQLFLLHKFSSDGRHVHSFLELDPDSYDYDSSGDSQKIYRVLHRLIDLAAVGICPRGIFAVVPGTRKINFYNPNTLALTEVVELQAPSVSLLGTSQSMTDDYGQLHHTSLNIRKLQVKATEIEAEFLQSQIYGTPARALRNAVISCRYNSSGNLLAESKVRFREAGTLIPPTGTTAYADTVKLRTRDGSKALLHD